MKMAAYETIRSIKGALSRSLEATADQERHLRIAQRPVMEKLEKWLEGFVADAVQIDPCPYRCVISIWMMTQADAEAVLVRIMGDDDLRRRRKLTPNGYSYQRRFNRGRLFGEIVFRVFWYEMLDGTNPQATWAGSLILPARPGPGIRET